MAWLTDDMEFYKTDRWLKKRDSILRRDHYRSRLAQRYGKFIPAEIVHHIFPRTEFPEYAFSDWNLISITKSEHNRLHDRETNELTEEGAELLRRTARQNNIPIPEKYVKTVHGKTRAVRRDYYHAVQ